MTPDLKESAGSPIHSIQIETTSRCNLSCVTCLKPVYQKVWQQRDMDLILFKKILQQIGDFRPNVHLQGWGEPMVQSNFLSFVQKLKREGINTSFTTNGTVMTESLVKSIIESGVDGVTFSMAGGCAVTQDKLRGKGTFLLLRNAVTSLVDLRTQYTQKTPRIAISYLLTEDTVKELPGAVSWCRGAGVDAFVTVALTQSGGALQNELAFLPSRQEAGTYRLLRIRTHLSALAGRMKLHLKPFYPTMTPVCDKNPLNNLFISANGDVSPCVFLAPPISGEIEWHHSCAHVCQQRFVMGNLHYLTLKEIWETDEYEAFREQFRQRKRYHDAQLSTVSYSLSGSQELEAAVEKIEKYFTSHPAPRQCMACAKLQGY